jgi:diguanylate cyclase (GGDEF)-like protein/PAS domain S-box-containing protein
MDNPQPMWVYDNETLAFLEVNRAAEALYGYTREEFLGMAITDIRPAEEVKRLRAYLADRNGEPQGRDWRHRLASGRLIWVDVRDSPVDFGGRAATLVLATDVTDRREMDGRLVHQAFHDALTGLANRALFRDRVEHAVGRAARGGTAFAVLFIDLDNFKSINDSVGHTAGDAVLVEVANRLTASIRPTDTAARLGGDEFSVLMDLLPRSQSAALQAARRIATALNKPIDVAGDEWLISGSIGIAYSDSGETADAVLRSADVAMYDAKKRGRAQFAVFEPSMHESLMTRLAMETELRKAISTNTLEVAFQPQVDLRTAAIIGVEALLRWCHPTDGSIPPSEFIPLAEEAGIIRDLDLWVMRAAAAQVRRWVDSGLGDIKVGINVSGKDFSDPRLVEHIVDIVTAEGLAPRHVELEVTESVAFEAENARSSLVQLRKLGFSVAIDDFGVGFSMLGRLQDLPVDRLKIDRSFIERITFGEDEAPIVTGIIAMAHSLRLKVVAEGIETSEQLKFLRLNGCDHGQGYRLGRPMTAEQIEPILMERGARYSSPGGD